MRHRDSHQFIRSRNFVIDGVHNGVSAGNGAVILKVSQQMGALYSGEFEAFAHATSGLTRHCREVHSSSRVERSDHRERVTPIPVNSNIQHALPYNRRPIYGSNGVGRVGRVRRRRTETVNLYRSYKERGATRNTFVGGTNKHLHPTTAMDAKNNRIKECITVSAPGKVLVAGGYLVLDRPNVGVVLAATARFFTTVKWTGEKSPMSLPVHTEESGIPPQLLRIKVESPQFRCVYWYECVFHVDGTLPTIVASPNQASNIFVERSLSYVLGYLFCENSDIMKKALHHGRDEGLSVAIKLRADNDFYSQTNQLKDRGLPPTAEALATLPRFLECPVSEGGTVVVAKTGMGSSAALTSSLVGGLLSFFGAVNLPCVDGSLLKEGSTETPSNDSKPDGITSCPGSSKDLDLTHNLAQACHCVAQGKVGSGFDVSAAIYGTHTYTRFSPGNLAEALSAGDDPWVPNPDPDGLSLKSPLERIASCVRGDGGWDAQRGVLRLPSSFRLLMGDVCGGSSTPSMVRKVQAWRVDPATADRAKELWSTLGTTNTAIADALNSLATEASSVSTTSDNSFETAAKILSAIPSSEWENTAGIDKIGTASLQQLLQLKISFAKARQLLREMGEGAGVPIEPPVQTKLVDATCALPGVLCAGVPGAGGVDAVFAIVVHPNAEAGVKELWASWSVGEDGEDGKSGGGVVCPLLLTVSKGGMEGGILCTKKLPWE